MSRMVRLLASFISLSALRATASRGLFSASSVGSGSLHEGQRLAKPGLPGRSSNSSEQTTQVLIGKAIQDYDNADNSSLVATVPERETSHTSGRNWQNS